MCYDTLTFGAANAAIGFNAPGSAAYYNYPSTMDAASLQLSCGGRGGCYTFRVDGSAIVSAVSTTLTATATGTSSATHTLSPTNSRTSSAQPSSSASATVTSTTTSSASHTSSRTSYAVTRLGPLHKLSRHRKHVPSSPSAPATPVCMIWGVTELAQAMSGLSLGTTAFVSTVDLLRDAGSPKILPALPPYLSSQISLWTDAEVALAQSSWRAGGVPCANLVPGMVP